MRLLLDTSTFLWFITSSPRLPERVTVAIRSPENDVYLSVVSFWEILLKHRLGRLSLPDLPSTYIPHQRTRHRIEALSLQEVAVGHLAKLPSLHPDPFDRMLICQAIEHDLSIVTSDRLMHAYPIRIHWPAIS